MKLIPHSHRSAAFSLLCAALLSVLLLSGCTQRGPATPSAPPTAEPTSEPTPDVSSINVVISELMAANETCLRDGDGDFSDWVELYNPSERSCELTGFWLSDSEKEPQKWQIPALVIEPGQYRVIFLSGKDKNEGELHAGFALSRQGDELLLSSPMGFELLRVSFGALDKDASLCLDGEQQTVTFQSTPGYPNSEDGREAFIQANDVQNELLLNEFVTHNSDYNFHAGEFFDWVELRSNSDQGLNLADYYLTDDLDEPFKCQLPRAELHPGELYVVHLGTPEQSTSYFHTSFGLDSHQDALYLFRADGTLCDWAGVNDTPLNCSKGRVAGQSGFFIFGKRTPERPNADGCRFHCAVPGFVTAPGVYNDVENVVVELCGEGTIRYTTDGSVPTAYSPAYEEPLTLTATTCLRIASFADGKQQSDSIAAGYIINENHTLPVVNVAMNPREAILLYKYANDYDMDAAIAYYGPDGSFSRNCAVSIHGASSRQLHNKKSLKVLFKDRYGGDLHTDFDLFGVGITEFHSILLRGQDTGGLHQLRDLLTARVANDTCVVDPLTLDGKHVALYLNGQYYGLYNLREAYSPKYLSSHTGSDEDASIIVRAPFIKNGELMDLYSYMQQNDLSDSENYRYVAERFDMQSLAQWFCFESYFNNLDPTGNIRYCKGTQPDSKWRVMFFDLDISLGSKVASCSAIYQLDSQIGQIFSALDKSEDFRLLVLQTASQLYHNGLHHDTLLATLDELSQAVADESKRDLKRWFDSGTYDGNLARQRNFMTDERDSTWVRMLQTFSQVDDDTMRRYFPDFYA